MKSREPKRGQHATEKSELEKLLLAILDDDDDSARRLLKRAPSLATALIENARLYETRILHWLYANDSALHLAAAGHRVAITRTLIAAGADPNVARNHRFGRPLHYAADGAPQGPLFDESRQVETIRCLLSGGADLHAADKNGATALHRAVRTRCAAAVECLLDAGADHAAANQSGATPFHLAVQNTGRGGTGDPPAKAAQRRIIELMLERNADLAVKDARGKSVVDWATSDWVRQVLAGTGRGRG